MALSKLLCLIIATHWTEHSQVTLALLLASKYYLNIFMEGKLSEVILIFEKKHGCDKEIKPSKCGWAMNTI